MGQPQSSPEPNPEVTQPRSRFTCYISLPDAASELTERDKQGRTFDSKDLLEALVKHPEFVGGVFLDERTLRDLAQTLNFQEW